MKGAKKRKAFAAGVAVLTAASVGGVYVGNTYFQPQSVAQAKDKKKDIDFLKKLTEKKDKTSKEETDGIFKDESVYVLANADGSQKKITVTDWLKNAGDEKELKDYSELEDIENVKGDEQFAQNGGELTWSTKDADIYYQGTTDKKLPITEKITYKLDGSEISPKELKGKSGRLEMVISFENNSKKTVKLDGKEEELYTPFTVVTGVILPEENFSHVSAENGKIFSDATRKVVAGMAFPGLKESLGLAGEDVDIPESITIKADVENFQIGPTLTVATADVMSEFGLSDIDSFDDLEDSLEKMSDASGQLVNGSKELSDGLDTLQSGTGELKSGVNALTAGMGDLKSGAKKLAAGVSQYTAGADKLAGGAKQYVDGTVKYTNGVNQYVAATGQLAGGVKDISAGVNKAKGGSAKLVQAGAQLKEGLKQADASIAQAQQAAGAVEGSLTNIAAYLMPKAQAGDAEAAKLLQQISQLKDQLGSQGGGASVSLEKTFGQYYDGVKELDKGLGQLKSGVDTAQSKLKGLPAAKKQLRNAAGELKSKGQLLKSGGGELSANSGELRNGAKELLSGSEKLAAGGDTLAEGGDALISGVNRLAEGGRTLKDGMAEFDKSAVSKLTDLADAFGGDIETLIDRLNAMSDLAKEYKSFAGAPEDMDGSVKFVIETAEIE